MATETSLRQNAPGAPSAPSRRSAPAVIAPRRRSSASCSTSDPSPQLKPLGLGEQRLEYRARRRARFGAGRAVAHHQLAHTQTCRIVNGVPSWRSKRSKAKAPAVPGARSIQVALAKSARVEGVACSAGTTTSQDSSSNGISAMPRGADGSVCSSRSMRTRSSSPRRSRDRALRSSTSSTITSSSGLVVASDDSRGSRRARTAEAKLPTCTTPEGMESSRSASSRRTVVSSSSMRSAASDRTLPAAVSTAPVGARSRTRVPHSRSSRRICWETADGVM